MERLNCDLCDKSFASKQRLNSHISAIHEGIKPVVKRLDCSFCDSSFASKQRLKTHIESIHEGKKTKVEKLYCDFCEKSFSSKQRLIGHISVIHEGKDILDERSVCGICGITFASKQRLNSHIASVHARKTCPDLSGFPPKQTDLDEDTTVSLANDKDDILEKKKDNVCPVCDSKFPNESELNFHAFSVHDIENLEEFENFGLFSKEGLQQINDTVNKSFESRDLK